jgi:hypothetical protein
MCARPGRSPVAVGSTVHPLGQLLQQRHAEAEQATRAVLPLEVVFAPAEHFCSPRGYAMVWPPKQGRCCVLQLSKKTLRVPVHRADGLVRHELGHVVDIYLNPRQLDRWARSRGVELPKTPERRADAIALAVWGQPIRYDEDLVQSTLHGQVVRPAHLGL